MVCLRQVLWGEVSRCLIIVRAAVQYSTIQYNAVQYSTMQYNTVQCNTMQYSAVQYSTMQYNTIQCSTVQYYEAKIIIAYVFFHCIFQLMLLEYITQRNA